MGINEPNSIQNTNKITGARKWWAMGAVLVTLFFSALDQTIVSTAMPTIIGDLKGLSLYSWVFTAYMIASAVTVPIYGKLSDIYGRKPFYLFGLGMFIFGSVLSGLAKSMEFLIFARVVQGIGGGAMMTMPRATIGDIFNPRERGKWMGIISSVFGIASIIGPFIGGWITDNMGWRWIFYINLPVAVIAFIAVAYALPKVRIDTQVKVDWIGSIILVIGLVPILLGFTWAGNKYAWSSSTLHGIFAFGALVLIIFFIYERRATEPVINPELFKNRIFSTTTFIGLIVSMAMFGGMMYLPLFIQGVVGLSASNSGVVLTPMTLSFIVGGIIGGFLITKTGRYKIQAIIAGIIMVFGMYLLTLMNVNTTWWTVVRNMLVLGLGIGSLMPLLNLSVQNAFPYKQLGVVNSTQQFVSSLGGVIVSPIFGTMMSNTFKDELPQRLPEMLKQMFNFMPAAQKEMFLNPQGLISQQAQEAIKAKFLAFGPMGEQIYNQFIHAVKVSLTSGIHKLFTLGVFLAFLGFLGTFLLKEIPLKREEYYTEE